MRLKRQMIFLKFLDEDSLSSEKKLSAKGAKKRFFFFFERKFAVGQFLQLQHDHKTKHTIVKEG